jgi:hypothetical protein
MDPRVVTRLEFREMVEPLLEFLVFADEMSESCGYSSFIKERFSENASLGRLREVRSGRSIAGKSREGNPRDTR